MDVRTVAAHDEPLAGMRRMDSLSYNPEPQLIDVLEMGLQRMRDTYARLLEPKALMERMKLSSPRAVCLKDTMMKHLAELAAACWRDLDDGPRENNPSPAADNISQVHPRRCSSLKSASPERLSRQNLLGQGHRSGLHYPGARAPFAFSSSLLLATVEWRRVRGCCCCHVAVGGEAREAEQAQPGTTIINLRTTTSQKSRNAQRFRGGLVFQAHGLCVSLSSRLESDTEEEEKGRENTGQHTW